MSNTSNFTPRSIGFFAARRSPIDPSRLVYGAPTTNLGINSTKWDWFPSPKTPMVLETSFGPIPSTFPRGLIFNFKTLFPLRMNPRQNENFTTGNLIWASFFEHLELEARKPVCQGPMEPFPMPQKFECPKSPRMSIRACKIAKLTPKGPNCAFPPDCHAKLYP